MIDLSEEHFTPAYEIRYRNAKGRLAHCLRANCDSDTKAKLVVDAMKLRSDSLLEVWRSWVDLSMTRYS
jgi:hypothetical protein